MTFRKGRKRGAVGISDGGWASLKTRIVEDRLTVSIHEYRSLAEIAITKREAHALRRALNEFIGDDK